MRSVGCLVCVWYSVRNVYGGCVVLDKITTCNKSATEASDWPSSVRSKVGHVNLTALPQVLMLQMSWVTTDMLLYGVSAPLESGRFLSHHV